MNILTPSNEPIYEEYFYFRFTSCDREFLWAG